MQLRKQGRGVDNSSDTHPVHRVHHVLHRDNCEQQAQLEFAAQAFHAHVRCHGVTLVDWAHRLQHSQKWIGLSHTSPSEQPLSFICFVLGWNISSFVMHRKKMSSRLAGLLRREKMDGGLASLQIKTYLWRNAQMDASTWRESVTTRWLRVHAHRLKLLAMPG